MSSTPPQDPSRQLHDLPPFAPAALAELLKAYELTQDQQEDPWQFAVSITELSKAGLSSTDLRWLVSRDHLQHGRETTRPRARRRRFCRGVSMDFSERSCFLLTPDGAAYLRRLLPQQRPGRKDRATAQALKPRWDRDDRQLFLGETVVKRFRRVALAQFAILDAFQEAGWPTEGPNPLQADAYGEARERLHDALKKLNRGQAPDGPQIRFPVHLGGRKVRWEVIASGPEISRTALGSAPAATLASAP